MEMPFTIEQFLDVFSEYNQVIWPAQVVAYILGTIGVLSAAMKPPSEDRLIAGVLTLFWVWTGAIYHMAYFTAINPAAWLFGGLFIAQGALFFYAGVVESRLKFGFQSDVYGFTGAFFLAYAMIFYPLLGIALGHAYPASPMFGVAPCPAVIFTFGFLLWTTRPAPKWLLVIPSLWVIVGLIAALELGMWEDIMLPIAGVAGVALLMYRDREEKLEPVAV